MNNRTIVLSQRMHELLLHALDCAGCWSFEEGWESAAKHVHGLNNIAEPLDCSVDLRKLINICKAAKISNPAAEAGEVARDVPPSASVGRQAAAGEGIRRPATHPCFLGGQPCGDDPYKRCRDCPFGGLPREFPGGVAGR